MLQSTAHSLTQSWWDQKLWLQWILANTVGEVLGLGLAGAAGIGLALAIGKPQTALVTLLLAALMIALGTLEGVIVGLAQWLVLHRRLPNLRRRAWVTATAIGAFVAWTLGMTPSTLMMLRQSAAAPPPPVLSDAEVYALAAAMGAMLGTILGIPQWRVLRRYAASAGWWVWANAAAWLAGMPLVFIGAGSAPVGASVLNRVLLAVATIAAAGAVVGAIHGLALLSLLRDSRGAPLRPVINFEAEP